MTYGRVQYIKMFSSLSGVRMVFWMPPYLNILCIRYKKQYYTKNTNQFSMTFNYYTYFPQNWQSSLTVNISRSTAIQHVYCTLNTIATLLAVGLAIARQPCVIRLKTIDCFSVWYYINCVSLKLICISLNVKCVSLKFIVRKIIKIIVARRTFTFGEDSMRP